MKKDRGARGSKAPQGGLLARIPFWQKALLVLSLVVTVAGAAGWVYAAVQGGGPPADADGGGAGSGGGLVQGFAAGTTPPGSGNGEGAPSAEGDWAPALFRLGFSFFVGFCIAFALRTFFKISLVAIGLMLLALFGLQYFGLIDVDWNSMQARFDDVTGWLKEQTASFRTFVTGHLPSAASAAAGLVIGFKRG